MRPARWCKSMAVCANFLKIPCHQVSHQNKEFCRVMCDLEVAFKKLSKLASTQQIDRQWQGLKSSSFPICIRQWKQVKAVTQTLLLRSRFFSVCLANQLENQVSKDIPVSQVLREQRKRQWKTKHVHAADGKKIERNPLETTRRPGALWPGSFKYFWNFHHYLGTWWKTLTSIFFKRVGSTTNQHGDRKSPKDRAMEIGRCRILGMRNPPK